jgi:recombinational DNA repair ATPase RecF
VDGSLEHAKVLDTMASKVIPDHILKSIAQRERSQGQSYVRWRGMHRSDVRIAAQRAAAKVQVSVGGAVERQS